jgi:hypothetical protein
MSAINIPGFTAETSLYRANERYSLQPLRNAATGGEPAGVYPARFACFRGVCVCNSDEDCNGMFSTSCSEGGYAKCWVRGPGGSTVFCICSRA